MPFHKLNGNIDPSRSLKESPPNQPSIHASFEYSLKGKVFPSPIDLGSFDNQYPAE